MKAMPNINHGLGNLDFLAKNFLNNQVSAAKNPVNKAAKAIDTKIAEIFGLPLVPMQALAICSTNAVIKTIDHEKCLTIFECYLDEIEKQIANLVFWKLRKPI